MASREHTYVIPGNYEIKAALSGGARNGYTPASRMVRIVDYREEIVRLYNEMVATLRSQGVALTPRMTAREVESRLNKAGGAVSRQSIGELVSLFEEANYSLHPIARRVLRTYVHGLCRRRKGRPAGHIRSTPRRIQNKFEPPRCQ